MKKKMRIVAHQVMTESKVCKGIAKTKQGEIYEYRGRTPENPMCIMALNACLPMAHAMSLTDKMAFEDKDYFEVTCPHGCVVYRIYRAEA